MVALSMTAIGSFAAGKSGASDAHGTTACLANPAWFPHQQTPKPDSAGFPSSPNNCDFHQWSWQAFLWLTQTTEGGRLRFETLPGPEALDEKGGKLPGYNPFVGRTRQPGKPVDGFLQAGPDGILVDQNGRVVYYSMYINDIFEGFVEKYQLNDPAKLRAFDPNTSFPVDTLTLKAAWKIVKPDEDASGFYTRKVSVNKLVNKGGKITLDPSQTEAVTVALVGFHIAGTVNNHPEMIWATFEHISNAPDLAKPLDMVQPNDVVSDKNWTFYKAGTPFKNCNVNAAGAGDLKLDETTQTLSPVTDACRLYPYGSDLYGKDPGKVNNAKANANNIQSINSSVQAQVDGVWKNYFEVGAIWFNAANVLKPGCNFLSGSLNCDVTLTGSTLLSNTVIETFTQSQSEQDNCFACHNTLQDMPTVSGLTALPAKNVNISHILSNQYFKAQQPK